MKKNNLLNYLSAESFIESLSSFEKSNQGDKKNLGKILERTKLFLQILNNPEKNLKIIHIAGTAGKGSVSKIIQYQICKNGHKCGLYTSPHVSSTTERIQVNEDYIPKAKYVEIVDYLKPKLQELYEKTSFVPSYFELNFVIGLLYFKELNCEYAVIETGMGGRFDCTNILSPILTIITNIGIDHTKYLGNTKEEIAYEKAGIIKEKIKLITAEKDNKILKIFKKIATEKLSEIEIVQNKTLRTLKTFPKLVFINGNKKYSSELLGVSQIENILLAEKATQNLGLKFFTEIKTNLPARLEIVSRKPLIVLDGAHNELKIQNFKHFAQDLPHEKLIIIFALSEDKKLIEIAKILKSIKKEKIFFITRIPSMFKKSVDFKDLKKLFTNEDSKFFLDPNMALNEAKSLCDNSTAILVTGSFFLAGYLRENYVSKGKILNLTTKR